ncbi:hypothetical protein [Pandoraea terrigena]|uniref:RiboL-PSP-HEPN domain-containing protein n=1 Tax=Pandoraea terrigena TaxID=2508292 RepID=A0A5E4UP10_9BURK|nr:hypothetical protein [Pandoraea terrigena]VVE01666.1 hypothetical protein PTE31013_02175 [Pandoraea terrigena]
MSYDEYDAARDEFYDEVRREAINDFTSERLQSYYDKHPDVMRPAVLAISEGGWQQKEAHFEAAIVFFTSAVEMLLKATLLRPVIYGLVHSEALAEAIVQRAMSDLSLDRYTDLLAELFFVLAKVDVKAVRRDTSSPKTLLNDCKDLQIIRNGIVHRGEKVSAEQAEFAREVTEAVFERIVIRMLQALNLTVIEHGQITQSPYQAEKILQLSTDQSNE